MSQECFKCQKLIGSNGSIRNSCVHSKVSKLRLVTGVCNRPDVARSFDFSNDTGNFDFYIKSSFIQMLTQIKCRQKKKLHYDHAW